MRMSEVKVGMKLREPGPTGRMITVVELTEKGFKYCYEEEMPFIPRLGLKIAKDGHEHYGTNGECYFEVEWPEHEKLHAIKPQADIITGFLEWLLEEKKFHICQYVDKRDDFYPINKGIEAIAAEYFQIDLNKISKEKDEMVKQLQDKNTVIKMDL